MRRTADRVRQVAQPAQRVEEDCLLGANLLESSFEFICQRLLIACQFALPLLAPRLLFVVCVIKFVIIIDAVVWLRLLFVAEAADVCSQRLLNCLIFGVVKATIETSMVALLLLCMTKVSLLLLPKIRLSLKLASG